MAKKKTVKKSIKEEISKEFEKELKKEHKGCCGSGHKEKRNMCSNGCGYGLGVVGALVYYISTATGFWSGVYGVFKAILWPAFLVYELLRFLGA